MKQNKTKRVRRDERGSVTVIVAVLLTTLFAFSAFAVDMGFRYTKSRTLQAVADAAVTAGMPSMVAHNTTTAYNKARDMAQANGFTGSNVAIDSTGVAGQLTVTTSMTAPSFFSAIFRGGAARTISSTAVGVVTASPGPALLALGNCSSSPGLSLSGNGKLTINGDIDANSNITISTGGGSQPQTDTGSVQSRCGAPTVYSSSITYTGGGILAPATSNFSDPFATAATTTALSAVCTNGTSLTTSVGTTLTQSGSVLWAPVVGESGMNSFPGGVYCSNSDINFSGPGTGFIANGVTLISTGHVILGADNTTYGSSISAASGVPANLAIYAGADLSGGPAINLGSNRLTVNGSVYAPYGLANLNGETGMAIYGSVIAQDLQIGIGDTSADWTFDPTGSAGANTWRMYK